MFIFTIVIELCIGILLLFLVTKILGRSQIHQITPFDFISALVLGELIGNAIYDDKIGILHIFFAVFIWGLLLYCIQWMELKSITLREILDGKPCLVIEKGVIQRKLLKKHKISIDQLQNLLRQKNVFSLREVEYALLESNGMISVLQKIEYQTAQKRDIHTMDHGDDHENTKVTAELPVVLISDGSILNQNLNAVGMDEQWLYGELFSHGIKDVSEVMYAEYTSLQGLYVIEKQ
ncbi:DUF421 domain-containing protein [Longirhabdus pacifica]|uniref:DUF421 domain-containing protein n=1 Tax=Longirhabdus pacifica TaxID=2305227 RepID=UPI0010086A3E|nr:DUF421 domain-containing protein [Longirhabdus pacifica]